MTPADAYLAELVANPAPRTRKVTVAKAMLGRHYSIRRGRSVDQLGELVEKVRGPRGYNVRFVLDGVVTYNGFAGGATVVLERVA